MRSAHNEAVRDGEGDAVDESRDSHAPDALVEQMQARIDSLEHQLEQTNEQDRENRRIIAALTARIPEI